MWFLAQRFLRNWKIRIFREMAAIWFFWDLPIFYITGYGKMGQNWGSEGKSNWPYFQSKLTFGILNWLNLIKYSYILWKKCKMAEKNFFGRFWVVFRQKCCFCENLPKILKSLRLLQKWCWKAQIWLETNYGTFLRISRKQNFDLGPIFHFLGQNMHFWAKLAIFG